MLRIFTLPSRQIALLIAASVATATAQNAGSGSREEVPIRFKKIIIPRLEFREATPLEAIEFLARKARDLDQINPGQSSLVFDFDPSILPDARITLSLRNVSLDQALRHMAAPAGLRVLVKADGFRIDVPQRGSLPRLGSRIDSTQLSSAQRALLAKASRLIVPRLEFRDATIREAADFFRKKSAEIDEEEPNLASRGVNLLLIRPPSWNMDPRLTMSFTNAPLLEILTAAGRLSGSELRLSDIAFVLDFTDAKPARRESEAPAER